MSDPLSDEVSGQVNGPAGLATVLARWAAGELEAADLQAAFEAATLFVRRMPSADGRPAVAALGRPGAGLVAFYSSLDALARHTGHGDWASARGGDLLDLVPPGYGVVVDPAGPHPATLSATAFGRDAGGVVIAQVVP